MDRRSFLTGTLAGAGGAAAVWTATRVGSTQPLSIPLPLPQGRLSYSQMGEDLVLHDMLHLLMKLERPTYIDIGAADPISVNNTYLLYKTGSRGVLVEPNPTYVAKLRRARPGDIVVGVGVGVDDTPAADYYIIRGKPMLNTFSPETVARLQKESKEPVVEKVVKMPLVSLNRLIATHLGKAPDLLSTDVEGLDLAILRTLDFERYRPAVIITETLCMKAPGENSEITDLLTSHGYVVRGGSVYNTIYADPKRYS